MRAKPLLCAGSTGITRQLERVERDQSIAIETLALFVRFWLTVTPPLARSEQGAAKAKGAERYRDFVERSGGGCSAATASCASQLRDLARAARATASRGGSAGPADPSAEESADAG